MLALHHLAVKTRNLIKSEVFYAQMLGLPLLKRHDDARGPRSIWLGLGNTGAFLAVERADDLEAPTRLDDAAGWHCIALTMEVSARADWVAKLEAAGHPIFHQTPYSIYVRDPDGAVVALSHYPHEAR